MARFSKGEAITHGWGMATRHLGFFVVALIVVGVASAVPSRLQILGFLALFVGAFVAIPAVLMAAVFVYRKLLVAAEGPALAPQAPPAT
jgi:uncharacterized membrane protein